MVNSFNQSDNQDDMQNDQNGDQPQAGQTHIAIYVDGSSIGNPGYGGCGVVILQHDHSGAVLRRQELSIPHPVLTTNIRMEMAAAAHALERLGDPTDTPITIFCDANLIPNTINRDLAKWKAKGWRKSDGKEPNNRDLWERMERAAEGRNVTWAWVRGHNGAVHNERAHKLAYQAARRAEARATSGT